MSHHQALTLEGVSTVYAASPEVLSSFEPLFQSFGNSISLGAFPEMTHMLRLLSRYYFGTPEHFPDLPLTAASIEKMWIDSAGYPHRIQKLAARTFEVAHARRHQRVELEDVDDSHEFLLGTDRDYVGGRQEEK